MLQIAKGGSSPMAEQLLLLSHNQICLWVKRLNKEGIKGLYDKPKTGRKSRITEEQISLLKDTIINKLPSDFGFNAATWSAPIIVQWLKTNCNVIYSDDAVYLLLKKRMGLTHKKGKGDYPEADKKKRADFLTSTKKNSKKKQNLKL